MKKRRFAGILAIGFFLFLMSSFAFAGYNKVGELLDDDSGTVFELFKDENGNFFVWVVNPDGTQSGFDIPSEGNPDPDDPDGIGGQPDIKELAKRYHEGKLGKGVQKNNPLNLKRSGQGKGLDPRWNPPESVRDPDGSGGGSGSGPKDAEWIKDQARRGGGEDDEGEEGGQGGYSERPGIGETGSVQPERVNPVPFLRNARPETMSMEKWQPPVEGGMEAQTGAAPVEAPARTITPVTGEKPVGPAVTRSGGGETPAPGVHGRQPTVLTPTVKTAPDGRVQPIAK